MSGQVQTCPDVDVRALAASCADVFDLRGTQRVASMPLLLSAASETLAAHGASKVALTTSALVDLAISDPSPRRVQTVIKAIVRAADLDEAFRLVSHVARCPTDQLEALVVKTKSPRYAYMWAKVVGTNIEAMRSIVAHSPYYGMLFDMEFPNG